MYCAVVEAQYKHSERMEFLSENVFKINEIDKNQFTFLKDVLKEKRIVWLGEATHFDGTTLKAKSELIEYLHEELGYEVLLLEYGFFECRKAWFDIVEKRDSSTGVFAFLTKIFGTHISENQKELYRYIGEKAQTEKPLEIGGIDIFESSIYQNTRNKDYEKLLRQLIPGFDESEIRKHYERIFRRIQTDDKGKLILEKYLVSNEVIISTLLNAVDTVSNINLKRYSHFMAQALKNTRHSLIWKNKKPRERKKHGDVLADFYTLRDQYMAENLMWYIENFYPDKKIIVSTSTYHMSRNLDKIKPRPYYLGKDAVPMGQFIWNKYKDDMYTIAFICHHGERGRIKNPTDPIYSKVKERKKKSLEGTLHSLGYKYGFLNLQMDSKSREFIKGICLTPSYPKAMKADWSTVYDGIFFIDEMQTDDWYHLKGRNDLEQPYFPR